MSRIEEAVIVKIARFFTGKRHPLGLKVIAVTLGITALTWLPLLLYIVFGPADGNPIGLGLLAMLGMAIAYVGVPIGALMVLIGHLRRKSGARKHV
jgi:hypothetical protein